MGLPLYRAPVESDIKAAAASKGACTRPPSCTRPRGVSRSRHRYPRPTISPMMAAMVRQRFNEAQTETVNAVVSTRRPQAVPPVAVDAGDVSQGDYDMRARDRDTEGLRARDDATFAMAARLEPDDEHSQSTAPHPRLLSIAERAARLRRDAGETRARRVRNQHLISNFLPGLDTMMSNTTASRHGGLGDRNRSLSPEGDGVWDTLLSSITPDPQPPSLGSSFASTNAGTSFNAVSQETGRASTPLTDYFASTIVCDPVDEPGGSDTENDDDEALADLHLTRAPRPTDEPRTYADVVAAAARPNASGEDGGSTIADQPFQVWGGVDGLQRIVTNLARREDIPDEWWAAAGLSRTLSRETES